MWYEALILAGFVILLGVALWPNAQRLLLLVLYRTQQTLVAVLIIGAAVASIQPAWVPHQVREALISSGLANAESIATRDFWAFWGLLLAFGGITCVVVTRHICGIPEVARHLGDIKHLLGRVSGQVDEARRAPHGQGTLRRAVDTMKSYFGRSR